MLSMATVAVRPKEPNIELLLDQIEIACVDAKRRQSTEELDRLSDIRHLLRKAIVRAAILDAELWLRPDKSVISEKFGQHIKFLARVMGNRQPGQAAPWIFTTNYDLAIEWAAEALAQCGTWAAFRLSNDADQKAVAAAAETAGVNVARQLAGLGRGEAIVFGAALPVPTRLFVVRPNPEPNSKDPPFLEAWGALDSRPGTSSAA